MAAELLQIAVSTSTVIAVVLVAIVLIGGITFFLLRSSAGKKEREGRMRTRLMEMEREAQFAAAADRVAHGRSASEVALNIAGLFKEYLSVQVLGIYATREGDALAKNILSSSDEFSGLQPSIPAESILLQRKPYVEDLSLLRSPEQSNTSQTRVEPEVSLADLANSVRDDIAPPSLEHTAPPVRDQVMMLPWQGPFQWKGLVVTAPGQITTEALEAYAEPLARLTDRLCVALELEAGDKELAGGEDRSARLVVFSRELIAGIDETAASIVREVRVLMAADSAALWRVDETSGMVSMVASDGLKSAEFLPLPIGQGLAGSVVHDRTTIALRDAPSDPRCIFPREARESGIRSYLGIPLSIEDKTIGVIEVHSTEDRQWSPYETRELESAATIIAELVNTSESRGHRLRTEAAYLGLSEALQRLRSPDEVKAAVVEVLGHALGASRVLVVEFNGSGDTQPIRHEYHEAAVKPALGASFGASLVSRFGSDNGQAPIAINNSTAQSLMEASKSSELGVQSEVALPISVEGKTQGIVYIHQCDRPREWDREEVEFSERVARQLSLSLTNLRALDSVSRDAAKARADLAEALANANPDKLVELEQKVQSLERVVEHSRTLEEQSRAMLARASALESKARIDADAARRAENDLRQKFATIDEDRKRLQNASQQLLEINRLKSEFIVNAGREIEATLQSVLGVAELLERGSYGVLTPEQRQAVHGLYGWARRIKNDVDWLIEYGSARSRRLEPSDQREPSTIETQNS